MSGPADNDKSFERVLASFLREDLGPSRQDCPNPGVLATYFEGKFAEPEARRLEAHLSQCSRCQAEAAVLVRLPPEPTAETGRGEPVVAPPVVAAPPEPSPEPESVAPPARPAVEAMRVQAEDVDEPRPVEDLRRWRRERDSRRRRRRTLWTWLGPVALAASAVLAISVTYRFTPLIEYASRRSRESGSTARAPESARERGANRGTSVGEALEAPQAGLTTPTTAAGPPAPTEPDEMQGAGPGSAPPEAQSRQEAEAISPAPARVEPQANAGPTASAPERLARSAEPS
ncbi:MAG TPA: zf-HC2 domain-containing protein, partial [Candidatus Binatia bacterium]|nr:zf-HC2 domain-containing protein [Candidatus Binatia bacterium]